MLDIDAGLDRVQAALRGTHVPIADAALDEVLGKGTESNETDVPEPTSDAPLVDRMREALREYLCVADLLDKVDTETYAAFLAALQPRVHAARRALGTESETLLQDALHTLLHDTTDAEGLSALDLGLQTSRALDASATHAALVQMERGLVAPLLSRGHTENVLSADVYADEAERAQLHTLTGLMFGDAADCAAAAPLLRVLDGILQTAQSLKSVSRISERVGGGALDVFNDVLWRTASGKLMDEHGGTLFFVGRPDAFHRNYTLVQHFLEALVRAAPSKRAAAAFRAHEATKALERRWQLSAFFHLRARETVTDLEAALRTPAPAAGFVHGGFAHLLHAFLQPWRKTRHVPVLAAREWRLSLHILSRYATWLASVTPAASESDTPSRSVTPNAPSDDGMTPEEVRHLQSQAALLSDARLFEERVRTSFRAFILPKILGEHEAEAVRAAVSDALDASLGHAKPLAPRIGRVVVAALQRKCAEPLRHVRAASSQFRALAAKQGAPQASAFIPQIFLPLRQFLGDGAVAKDVRQAWASEVIDSTLARYTSAVQTITRNLESLRRLKRGTPALQDEGGDSGVYAQLRADIAALRADVAALEKEGDIVVESGAWASLEASVAEA